MMFAASLFILLTGLLSADFLNNPTYKFPVVYYGLSILGNSIAVRLPVTTDNITESNTTERLPCIPRPIDEDISLGNDTEAINISDYCNNQLITGMQWTSGSLAGLIVGLVLLIVISGVGIFFAYSYHSQRTKQQKLQANAFVSSNYIGGSLNESETGHCNLTISAEPYDIDDLCSLDNDNFLHSLESSVFANYMMQHHLHRGKTYSNPSNTHPIPKHSDLPPSYSISQHVPETPINDVCKKFQEHSSYSKNASMTGSVLEMSRNSAGSGRTAHQPYHFHPHLSVNPRSSRHKSGPSSVCSTSTISTTITTSITKDTVPTASLDSPPIAIKEIEISSSGDASPSNSKPSPTARITPQTSPATRSRAPVRTSSIGTQQLSNGYQQQNLHRVSSFPDAIPSYVVTV